MKALDARLEVAKPTVAALVVVAVAGVAWAVMVQHSRSMAGMDGMDMGLGPIESFAATWVVMMAAMMLPRRSRWSWSSRERPNGEADGRSPLECLRARTSACG